MRGQKKENKTIEVPCRACGGDGKMTWHLLPRDQEVKSDFLKCPNCLGNGKQFVTAKVFARMQASEKCNVK